MLPNDKILIGEFQYYLKNKDDITNKYVGRFIVIKNNTILGDYGSSIDAFLKTKTNHKTGTFLVLFCSPKLYKSKSRKVYNWNIVNPLKNMQIVMI